MSSSTHFRTTESAGSSSISPSYLFISVEQAPREELDPYEQLELDLDPELTEIEVVLELLGLKVLERLNKVATEVAAFEASCCCWWCW